MRPNWLYHLGGGQGGIEHFLEQFRDNFFNAPFKRLQTPDLNDKLCEKLIKGIREEEVGQKTNTELEATPDEVLKNLYNPKEMLDYKISLSI